MTDLLRELDAVVALSEKATQGEWLYRQGTAIVILGQGAGGFDLSACPQPAENAQAIASAVNFIRTHHAEIADMAKRLEAVERDAEAYRQLIAGVDAEQLVAASEKHGDALGVLKDAARYRWLRDHARFHYEMGRMLWYLQRSGRGFMRLDESIDAAIDAHNSAREAGE